MGGSLIDVTVNIRLSDDLILGPRVGDPVRADRMQIIYEPGETTWTIRGRELHTGRHRILSRWAFPFHVTEDGHVEFDIPRWITNLADFYRPPYVRASR